jgi:energy-coupling factor transporter ATP-binding protein EcfA2
MSLEDVELPIPGYEDTPLPKRDLSAFDFLDKSVALYGPSGSGKTVVMTHIMELIQPHVEVAIIVSPQEPTNQSYKGIVDPQLIHFRFFLPDPSASKKENHAEGAKRFLNAIWQRQEALLYYTAIARDPENIKALLKRLKSVSRDDYEAHCDLKSRIAQKKKEMEQKLRHNVSEKEYKETMARVSDYLDDCEYKSYSDKMQKNLAKLWALNLTSDERNALARSKVNPRILLVLDDCAAELSPIMKLEIFKKFMYQGRHCKVTLMVAAQDDTDLDSKIRKNFFRSVFCTRVVADACFGRKSNNYPKHYVEYVRALSDPVFKNELEFKKLIYFRLEEKFYWIRARKPAGELKFCSSAVRELCKKVAQKGPQMDKSNPFGKLFMSY